MIINHIIVCFIYPLPILLNSLTDTHTTVCLTLGSTWLDIFDLNLGFQPRSLMKTCEKAKLTMYFFFPHNTHQLSPGYKCDPSQPVKDCLSPGPESMEGAANYQYPLLR